MTDELSAFIERYTDSASEHRWRVRARNRRILADSGEGYKNPGDMEDAIILVRQAFCPPVDEEGAGWATATKNVDTGPPLKATELLRKEES